jgi:hypothetical protein
MTSLVNPYNINGNYPIAGQDNDSQGFRDNFTNIKNNFIYTKSDIEDLQSKVILKTALSGTTLDNNFLGSQVSNIQTKNHTETVYDWGTIGGSGVTEIVLDYALGNVHKINAIGSIKINAVIKNQPAALQFSRLLLYINIDVVTHTLELPSSITTDLTSIPGLRTTSGSNIITFTDPGSYIFEFSTVASGSPQFVRELTKGNPVFRDPNFYMAGIGGYTRPSLYIGWGNLIAVGSKIDSTTKGGTDSLSIRGSMTAWSSWYDDTTTFGGNNTPYTMTQSGFSVAKSRTVDQGPGVTSPTEVVLSSGDYIGYFNALGYTQNISDAFNSYQQMAAIGFYANGSSYKLGGNIVMFTKTDGGKMLPAMSIDSNQNTVLYGSLDVKGNVTVIESQSVTVTDQNIVVAQNNLYNSGSPLTANAAGIGVDQVWANIYYITDSTYPNLLNAWNVNKPFIISANVAGNAPIGAVPNSQNAGSLVVYGGVTMGGNLNIGGQLGLTSTLDATTTTSAAFALTGGVASAKNIIAGGNIFGNSSAFIANSLTIGAGVGSSNQLIVSATTAATTTNTGALTVAGGAAVSGNVYLGVSGGANGVVILSSLNTSGTIVTDGNAAARTNTAALRVKGGTYLEGNVIIGIGAQGFSGNAIPGALFVDNSRNVTLGAINTGGVILGNTSNKVGMSVSGDMNLGTSTSGTLYIMNQNPSQGTPTGLSIGIASASSSYPTPFAVTQYSGSQPIYGGLTNAGGSNLFGNVYIGQPHDGSNYNSSTGVWSPTTRNGVTGKPVGAWSGNLYLLSGAISSAFNSGALVIPSVLLADGSQSDGGMGVAGNVYINSGGFIGTLGNSTTPYGNLVAASSVESTSSAVPGAGLAGTANGSFVALGGASIVKRLNVQGNVVANSAAQSTSLTTGAVVVTGNLAGYQGGLAVAGNVNVGQSVQFTSGTLFTTPNLSAIEYNSPVAGTGILYGTPAQNSRALVDIAHMYMINGSASINSGSNPTAATYYGVFGGASGTGTIGGLNAIAGTTYEIDIRLVLTHGTTPASSTTLFTFGGTATISRYNYDVIFDTATYGSDAITPTPSAPLWTAFVGTTTVPTTTTGIVGTANTNTNKVLRVKGFITINAAGTLVPQIAFGSTIGTTVQSAQGSYIKFTPVGGAGTLSIGNFIAS